MKTRAGMKMGMNIHVEVFDKGEKKSESWCHNIVTNEGLIALLDIMFHNGTDIDPWYCVMSESNTDPIATMTYASPVFTEWTAYGEETRPVWNEDAVVIADKKISNSTNKALFTANASKTLCGAGLVGGGSAPSTKGDTTGGGKLYNYGKFTTAQPVVDGNEVYLTITLSAADDGV